MSAWSLFGPVEQRVLRSGLSPEACVERLRAETGSLWNPFSAWTHPVRGSVTERGFRIVRSKRYRNSFEVEARGHWNAEGNGTRIDLTLGVSQWVRWIMMSWLGFIALFCVGWLAIPGPSSGDMPRLLERVFPLLLLAFGLGLVYFGRWLARDEPRLLLEFLRGTLECAPEAGAIE